MVALILLYKFPTRGPITVRTKITTIATRTRMRAYSTKPCPFSSLTINIISSIIMISNKFDQELMIIELFYHLYFFQAQSGSYGSHNTGTHLAADKWCSAPCGLYIFPAQAG